MKNRRPRTLAVIVGLALAALGGILWLVGDDKEVTGANRMDLHSSAVWGEVLGYESTEKQEYADAKDLKETGESLQTAGIVLGITGAGVLAAAFVLPSARRS